MLKLSLLLISQSDDLLGHLGQSEQVSGCGAIHYRLVCCCWLRHFYRCLADIVMGHCDCLLELQMKVKRRFAKISQSQWRRLLALSHLRHYCKIFVNLRLTFFVWSSIVYDAVWFYRRYFNIRPRCGGASVCTKSAPQSNVQYRLNANILWPFFHPNIWNIPKILDPGKFNALTQSVTLNYSFTWPPASQIPGAHWRPSAKIGNQQIDKYSSLTIW